MSDLQGRRIPGEEGSGRRRRLIWIILGLLLLLLLAVLIPFACQALNGGSGQGGDGQGAQGGAEQNADGNNQGDGAGGGAQDDQAQGDGGNGSGGSDTGGAGDRAGSGGQQEVASARLNARDQSGDGEVVTVPAATVEGTRGWLAVRADDGGEPGEVLGRSPLRKGENSDVEVELRRPLDSTQTLYATVHAERPADGEFTYPDGDPAVERGGQMVAEPISYQVEGGTPGETAADGIQDDELPESGGIPPTVLLAAATMLLASGAWGLRATLGQR